MWSRIAVGAVVLALGIGAVVLSQEPAADVGDDSQLTADDPGRASAETSENVVDAPGGATSPLVATNDAGEIIPPKSTTTKPASPATPASPASPTDPTTPAAPATPPDDLTPEERAYLDETKKTVDGNTGDLTRAVTAIADAMSGGDEATLGSMLAGDEAASIGFAASLAEQYPRFLESAPGENVNIFATTDTTVYIAYVLVTWKDGGIVSQHTIPVPLRFIDGEWRLTSLGDTFEDLRFVQSVSL